MSVKEFFELLWVNFIVLIKNTIEFFKVAFRYYGSFSFLKSDISLRLMYLFHNPFKISKRFLIKKGSDEIYTYGETPLTTMEMIAKECGIGAQDCVFELGCGRGRTCFWLNSLIGCSVVGIEYIPEFVERADWIKNRLGLTNIQFRLADMTKTEFAGATVCYLYGSCLDDKSIEKLAEHFSKLPKGTKIITVSYPLSDYGNHQSIVLVKRFSAPFTWGNADVFLHIIS